MFIGFNLELGENFFQIPDSSIVNMSFEKYVEIGKIQCEEHVKEYKGFLKEFIIKENEINGSKLEKHWFPQIETNLFISHSHIDEDIALAFAGWVFINFNLTSFIDSIAWGYVDDLLEELNDEYSNKRIKKDGGTLYSHKLCNRVSQHTNLMLNIALQKTIDSSEAVFLINTNNSIKKFDGEKINKTYSPWIYSEIVFTDLVRKKSLSEYRKQAILEHSASFDNKVTNSFNILYDIKTDHLINLTHEDLLNWENPVPRKPALDSLYKQIGLDIKDYIN